MSSQETHPKVDFRRNSDDLRVYATFTRINILNPWSITEISRKHSFLVNWNQKFRFKNTYLTPFHLTIFSTEPEWSCIRMASTSSGEVVSCKNIGLWKALDAILTEKRTKKQLYCHQSLVFSVSSILCILKYNRYKKQTKYYTSK